MSTKGSLNALTLRKHVQDAIAHMKRGDSKNASRCLASGQKLRMSKSERWALEEAQRRLETREFMAAGYVLTLFWDVTSEKGKARIAASMKRALADEGIDIKDIADKIDGVLKKGRFKFRPNRCGTRGARTNLERAYDGELMLSVLKNHQKNLVGESLRDALSNFLHFCDWKGLNFDEALSMARTHYAAER